MLLINFEMRGIKLMRFREYLGDNSKEIAGNFYKNEENDAEV